MSPLLTAYWGGRWIWGERWGGGGGMTDILYEGKIDMGRSVNIIYM
jgi:hypothetical protein